MTTKSVSYCAFKLVGADEIGARSVIPIYMHPLRHYDTFRRTPELISVVYAPSYELAEQLLLEGLQEKMVA